MVIDVTDISKGSSYFAYVRNTKKDQISSYIGQSFTEEEIDSGVRYIVSNISSIVRGLGYPPSATAVQIVIPKLKKYIYETPLDQIDPKIFPAISYTTKPYRELKGFLNKDSQIVGKAMDGEYRAKIDEARLPDYMEIIAKLAPEIIEACFEKLSLDIKEFNEKQRKAQEEEKKYQEGIKVKFAPSNKVARIIDEDEKQGIENLGEEPIKDNAGTRKEWAEKVRSEKRARDKENNDPNPAKFRKTIDEGRES